VDPSSGGIPKASYDRTAGFVSDVRGLTSVEWLFVAISPMAALFSAVIALGETEADRWSSLAAMVRLERTTSGPSRGSDVAAPLGGGGNGRGVGAGSERDESVTSGWTSSTAPVPARSAGLRELMDDVERVRETQPLLTTAVPGVAMPLWTSGPSAPTTYGTPGPGMVRLEVRHQGMVGGGHVNAVIFDDRGNRTRGLSVTPGWGIHTRVSEPEGDGTTVGTFYLTPEQARRFEQVYSAHGQGHRYRVGDSNLAMHSALIAAGFDDGVGLLYNPPWSPLGYLGYNNTALHRRWGW
jgi:hypothetical protein